MKPRISLITLGVTDLARARREVDEAFAGQRETEWFRDVPSGDLVESGIRAVVRWLGRGGSHA